MIILKLLLPEDEFKTLFHELKIEKSVIKIFYDNDRGGEARSGAFNPCFGTLWFCGH